MATTDLVFETPLGKQVHNVKNWSEISTALRDLLAASTSQDGSDDKWFITSGAVRNLTMVVDAANATADDAGGGGADGPVTRRPDIYLILVICTVVLLVAGALVYGVVSAVLRLFKVEPPDVDVTTVEVGGSRQAPSSAEAEAQAAGASGSNPPPTVSAAAQPSTSSAGTLTRLANGLRNFQAANLRLTATLRSTTSTKSDDNPPPYEDDLPPSYEAALKMSGNCAIAPVVVMTSCRSSSSSLSSAAAGAAAVAAATETPPPSEQTPPDETDGPKRDKKTSSVSKFNFSVV